MLRPIALGVLALAAGCASPQSTTRGTSTHRGDGASLTVRGSGSAASGEHRRGVASPSAGSGDPVADEEAERRLATRVTLDFDRVPLGQALEHLRDASGLSLAVSQAAQEKIDQDQLTATLRLRDVTVESALAHTLSSGDLTGELRGDTLVVELKGHARTRQVTAFYDVTELINRRPDHPAPEVGFGDAAAPKRSYGCFCDWGSERERRTTPGFDGDKLVALVESLIGGDRAASVELTNGLLVVRASESAHRRIGDRLGVRAR